MGVPTFYKWLCVKYPKVVTDAIEQQEVLDVEGEFVPDDLSAANPNSREDGEFDCLYLDMNGIIHPCCHPEDADAPADENQMFENIFDYMDRIFFVVRPRKLLYMAIDGVAPRAKMNQQRMRRFKTAADADQEEKNYEELRVQFESEGRPVPAKKLTWDSNVITPGTAFLDRLSLALRYYVNERMNKYQAWRSIKVILSDACCPGEGEHKIMQFIRSQRTMPDYDPNMRHCLYGADADLIMLGLATHEPRFNILREVVMAQNEIRKCYLCGKPGHLGSECTGDSMLPSTTKDADGTAVQKSLKSSWAPLQFLGISVLREYLENEFSFKDSPVEFKPDVERCIDDFVLMCFFVGNDFLPHLPSLSIQKGSIDQMICLYQKIRPLVLEDYLTDSGKINIRQLRVFVDHLGKVERSVFAEELKRTDRMNSRRREDIARVNRYAAEEKLRDQARELEQSAAEAGDTESTEGTDGTEDTEDDDNFRALKKLRLSAGASDGTPTSVATACAAEDQAASGESNGSQRTTAKRKRTHQENVDQFKAEMSKKKKAANEIEDPVDTVMLGQDNYWRQRYYTQKFRLCDGDSVDDFATRVAEAYFIGMRWVLGYYYNGIQSWEWYYPFHYAPFASDVAKYGLSKKSIQPFSLGAPFKPFQQLMAVLPARSNHCLPRPFARLMEKPTSPIIDFYPKGFSEDPDGKRFKWQWVVLLPFIDQKRLVEVLALYESELTTDEKRRNGLGEDRIMVHKSHPLAAQVIMVQSGVTEKKAVKASLSDGLGGFLSPSPLGLQPADTLDEIVDIWPESKSAIASCCLSAPPLSTHLCRFLPNAIPPKRILTPLDLQENPSSDKRFNAGFAKRLILGSLGQLGIIPKQMGRGGGCDMQHQSQYANYHNSGSNYHNEGVYSVNQYGREMYQRPPPHYSSGPGYANNSGGTAPLYHAPYGVPNQSHFQQPRGGNHYNSPQYINVQHLRPMRPPHSSGIPPVDPYAAARPPRHYDYMPQQQHYGPGPPLRNFQHQDPAKALWSGQPVSLQGHPARPNAAPHRPWYGS